MKILGFKNWLDQKEKSRAVHKTDKCFMAEKITPILYRLNPKVLMLHLDESGTNIVKSGHKISRYLIVPSTGESHLLEEVKEFINKERNKGKEIYLAGYDISTENYTKAYKNAKKLIESFNKKLGLDFVKNKSFGNLEKFNDHVPNMDLSKSSRIELWVTDKLSIDETEIPINFNPNSHILIEKYKTSLRGLLYRLILLDNQNDIKISAMKSIPASKRCLLNEAKLENERVVNIYNYKNPSRLAIGDLDNKPKVTDKKVSINQLTYLRAESVCQFLNNYSKNYGFKFIPDGLGIKEGASKIFLEF